MKVTTTLGREAESGSPQATLAVRNPGPVITGADVQRLFEPFERLDVGRRARKDGAGLGLSIVKAIAKAHQARLTAEAPPDGGLSIEVAFPTSSPYPDQSGSETVLKPPRATIGPLSKSVP